MLFCPQGMHYISGNRKNNTSHSPAERQRLPATANQAEKRRYRNPQKKALRHKRTISSESKEKKRHKRFREKRRFRRPSRSEKSILSILLSNWTPIIAGNTPSAANAVFTLTFNIELPRILCMLPKVIREIGGLKRL